jgi:hypothetical protein
MTPKAMKSSLKTTNRAQLERINCLYSITGFPSTLETPSRVQVEELRR